MSGKVVVRQGSPLRPVSSHPWEKVLVGNPVPGPILTAPSLGTFFFLHPFPMRDLKLRDYEQQKSFPKVVPSGISSQQQNAKRSCFGVWNWLLLLCGVVPHAGGREHLHFMHFMIVEE